MALREVLDQVRRMESDGVVARYAIGGAVGATIYLEPAATFDVDIFVVFKSEQEGALISLTPIYEYLRANGATIEGEHIRESGAMDSQRFGSIVSRHGLAKQWELFKSQFLGDR